MRLVAARRTARRGEGVKADKVNFCGDIGGVHVHGSAISCCHNYCVRTHGRRRRAWAISERLGVLSLSIAAVPVIGDVEKRVLPGNAHCGRISNRQPLISMLCGSKNRDTFCS